MKKYIIAIIFTLFAAPALANWTMGVAYSNLSFSDDPDDLSFNVATLNIGYVYRGEGSQFSFMPEIKVGTGVGDETIRTSGVDVKLEIDRAIAFTVRGSYDVNDYFTVFLQPSYTNVELTGSLQGISASEDTTEFGVGGGVSFNFGASSLEFIYEDIDDVSVVTAGYRYHF